MEAEIRRHIAFVLMELVSGKVSDDCPQDRLLNLLWQASTHSDDIGERAFKIAIKLIARCKIPGRGDVDKIVREVNGEFARELILSRILRI